MLLPEDALRPPKHVEVATLCVCVCERERERALTDGFNNKQHLNLNLLHVIKINIWNEDTRSTAEL